LGITAQAISKRASNEQLVAIRHGGQSWYPRWQFTDDGVVPGVPELLQRFSSKLALTAWMTTSFADLDGGTPAEMLRRRSGQRRVLELAQAASAEAW
jgi:hypothetical protein